MNVQLFTHIFLDANPGPGGWGVLLRSPGKERMLSGGYSETTNNRMELIAVIEGLRALKYPMNVQVITHAQYVTKGMTDWIYKWKANGWKSSNKKSPEVKNLDLWKELDALAGIHTIEWIWARDTTGFQAEFDLTHELAIDARPRVNFVRKIQDGTAPRSKSTVVPFPRPAYRQMPLPL